MSWSVPIRIIEFNDKMAKKHPGEMKPLSNMSWNEVFNRKRTDSTDAMRINAMFFSSLILHRTRRNITIFHSCALGWAQCPLKPRKYKYLSFICLGPRQMSTQTAEALLSFIPQPPIIHLSGENGSICRSEALGSANCPTKAGKYFCRSFICPGLRQISTAIAETSSDCG